MNVFLRILSDFPLGLMTAELLLFRSFRKKKYFMTRALLTGISFCILYAVIAQGYGSSASAPDIYLSRAMIVLIMLLSCLWLRFCFQSEWKETVFCMIFAYAIQNIHHNLYVNCRILAEAIFQKPFTAGTDALLALVMMAAVYSIAFLLIFNPLESEDISRLSGSRIFSISAFFILMTVFFIPELPESYSVTRLMNFFYYLAADCLMLFILTGMLKDSRQTKQLDVLEQLLYAEQRKQIISSETIDMINMKCHDMKHQIARIRESHASGDDYLKEAEDAIQIYDSSLHTGNAALDTVLMEKRLYCDRHDIQLSCMADGEKLSFMQPSDVYSLFGNALDNAIESVLEADDKEMRIISISVSSRINLLNIHIENYTVRTPQFENGLPATTKEDKKYHGYGMMSIQYIARKYDGEISASVDNHIFSLNIIIPLQ